MSLNHSRYQEIKAAGLAKRAQRLGTDQSVTETVEPPKVACFETIEALIEYALKHEAT